MNKIENTLINDKLFSENANQIYKNDNPKLDLGLIAPTD